MIKLTTSFCDIVLELDHAKAPLTAANFEKYVKSGHYDGTIFHRVIDGFMIQGGGFTADMKQKPTQAPIQNEAANGLKNGKYTIAMARTNDPHSASAQFFINVNDNVFLNHRSPDVAGFGYCVFGKVVEGQDVVDRIKTVKTGNKAGHSDVPLEPVVIEQAKII
jgi:peptidyl-prolyl cis-trans isomerase B (cyclophilin B)